MTALINRFYILGIVAVLLLTPFLGRAQESQILSVTPPLFQLSIGPGEIWQSSVKVVNVNAYELTVFAEVVNFVSNGELGHGRFIPILDDANQKATLAEWINISDGAYVIPPEQTREISFFVEIPENAAPGGHFAAILISTQPPASDTDTPVLKTSQVVTSLFFVRIDGDINESGTIREFSIEKTFVETPEASFKLRFENKGNVHIQPRGDIVITNMWGKERGVIPINNQTHYGNVLPSSIREFIFSWTGEPSLTDIGRYKALVTLTFGQDQKQNVTSTVVFWVIPLKATAIALGSILGFILLVVFMIRLYVRRMLTMAGVDVRGEHGRSHVARSYNDEDVRVGSYKTVIAPLREGASDLRSRLSHITTVIDFFKILFGFVIQYKRFFISITIIIVGFTGIVLYIGDAATDQRSYEIRIDQGDGEVVVDSEEILKDRLADEQNVITPSTDQDFRITIVNASGEPGVAAGIAVRLEELGYIIESLETDTDRIQPKTAVVFDESLLSVAQTLSELLDNALLSVRPEIEEVIQEEYIPLIHIVVGEDQEN